MECYVYDFLKPFHRKSYLEQILIDVKHYKITKL